MAISKQIMRRANREETNTEYGRRQNNQFAVVVTSRLNIAYARGINSNGKATTKSVAKIFGISRKEFA
jgi:hypothetical protein